MDIFGKTNDGSGTWARKPAGRTSVRQLLTKTKGKDGRRFWQCLSRSWDGTWKGTFIRKDKETLNQAGEMSMCLASHLRILLSHRRFTKRTICITTLFRSHASRRALAEVEMDIFGEANDGSGTWAVKPDGRTSVRQLLTKMKGKDGRRF